MEREHRLQEALELIAETVHTRQKEQADRAAGPSEAWKQETALRALKEGILKDPQWLERLNEPVPMWVLLDCLLRVMDKTEPSYFTYD
ncbi:hypothetical protein [Paenibacillus sp. y28]|uniref:hypothetical protein n=1 Tax=Paenibacillus sp. y28 TaxID=3129110 RepID=UPI003017C05D